MLPEGSMVEYLSVGSQEAPQTIITKKKFRAPDPKSQSQPSVQRLLDFFYATLSHKYLPH